MKEEFRRQLLFVSVKAGMICLVFLFFFSFIAGISINRDNGMTPSVASGDMVLYSRLDKNFVKSDVLVLDYTGTVMIRRVAATAGDTVDITDAGFTVNGSLQNDPHVYTETLENSADIRFPLTVPEGQLFVLADNRDNPEDSRTYGCISAEDITGKVMMVIRRRNI